MSKNLVCIKSELLTAKRENVMGWMGMGDRSHKKNQINFITTMS